MSTTPDLGIPNIASQQATPEITHNEAVLMLQMLSIGALTIGANDPPVSPVEGDLHIVGTAPTALSAWDGQANKLALYTTSGYRFLPDVDSDGVNIAIGARHAGLIKYVQADALIYVWDGSAWVAYANQLSLP